MIKKQLKDELDHWYRKICKHDFIALDPVQFPRRYKKREDIEIAAFLSAAIAWGRRDLILRSAEKMFALLGPSPYDYVMSGGFKKLKNRSPANGEDAASPGASSLKTAPSGAAATGAAATGAAASDNIHRTFFQSDLKYFCRGFKRCYAKYGSLENLFAAAPDIWEGIALFREEMADANSGAHSRHISNPGLADTNGSACKKFNLALRWLVREGSVDLGLWKKIKPASLFIPLDVHVARTARKLGLIERKSNDKRTVIALTEKLLEFCPQDPVKYDYALFGIGVTNNYLSPTSTLSS